MSGAALVWFIHLSLVIVGSGAVWVRSFTHRFFFLPPTHQAPFVNLHTRRRTCGSSGGWKALEIGNMILLYALIPWEGNGGSGWDLITGLLPRTVLERHVWLTEDLLRL